MKKVLLASTALIMVGGAAFADVTVGGDGRMGIIGGGADDATTLDVDESDPRFTSRIRISFTASGTTDGGLMFGGSIRADNAGAASPECTTTDSGGLTPEDAGFDPSTAVTDCVATGGGVNGMAGEVYAEGAYGRIAMGDVDSAAKAAVGNVSGVGLTGLGDLNEVAYLLNGPDPSALYSYSFGDATIYLGAENTVDADTGLSIGGTYSFGNYGVSLGYETTDAADHIIVGGSAAFGDATIKAIYGMVDIDANADGDDDTQYAISLDYVVAGTTLTAFYSDNFADVTAYGVGASYDLGGGASLKAGYADQDDAGDVDGVYDFGLSMSF